MAQNAKICVAKLKSLNKHIAHLIPKKEQR